MYYLQTNQLNRSTILNRCLVCIEPFSIVKKGDSFYCYSINDNDCFVAYSRRHEIEFKIPLSFLKYFRLS